MADVLDTDLLEDGHQPYPGLYVPRYPFRSQYDPLPWHYDELINQDPKSLGLSKFRGQVVAGALGTLNPTDGQQIGTAITTSGLEYQLATVNNGTNVVVVELLSGVQTTTTFTSTQEGWVTSDALMFRLNSAENTYSWNLQTAAFGLWTDEGNTNTKFPRCSGAVWVSQRRMLAFSRLNATVWDNVYYSNSGDPQTWNRSTNYVVVGFAGEGGITGFVEYQASRILVFKQAAIYELDISNPSPSLWTVRRLSSGIGSSYLIRNPLRYGNDVLFNYGTAVYSFNELMSASGRLPLSLTDDAKILTNAILINNDCPWYVFSNLLFLGKEAGQSHMVFNLETRRWVEWQFSSGNGLYGFSQNPPGTQTSFQPRLYALTRNSSSGNAYYAQLYDYDGTQTYSAAKWVDGTAVQYEAISRVLHFGFPGRLKKGVALHIGYVGEGTTNASLAVHYRTTRSGSWVATQGSPFTIDNTSNLESMLKIQINDIASFRYVQFRFQETSNAFLNIVWWKAFAYLDELEVS